MTVQELRDKLDHYIKHDIGDVCMLNDVKLDRQAYEDRCKARASHQVVCSDDETGAKAYDISQALGCQAHDAFMIIRRNATA